MSFEGASAEQAPPSVLVVEDDADLRLSMRLALNAGGWAVREVGTGAEAIASVLRDEPDVVVLDLGLPDVDGRTVLAQLKSAAETEWIPVVVLSGRTQGSEVGDLLRSGAQDYILKPFSPDELEARLIAARRVAIEHRRLATSQARYRTTFERAPVGMAEVGLDGRFVKVNQALCDMLGYESEKLVSTSLNDIAYPGDASRAAEVERAVDSDCGFVAAQGADMRCIHANGHTVWVSVSTAAINDGTGRLSHFLVHYVDVTDRKHLERQLQHLADHDLLTGLLNRRGFEAKLDRQADLTRRYGPSGALMVLDLDHFKQVNDTLGHNAGDELVVSMADLLRRTLRETDVVARLGGDEFAIILPYATGPEAEIVAGKVVAAVRDRVTALSGGHVRRVTVSVGVALFDDPNLTGEEVLLNADLTMYDAKEAGRDCYATYRGDSHDEPRTKCRLAWVDRINQAPDQERFELDAQPIIGNPRKHRSSL